VRVDVRRPLPRFRLLDRLLRRLVGSAREIGARNALGTVPNGSEPASDADPGAGLDNGTGAGYTKGVGRHRPRVSNPTNPEKDP